ncbi:hypothetical protein F4604DRAFT_1823416 [Suillus subluteus]|nr:hypothetical protein F4604DRAFT_1823416 [Suillus subluteus]
MATAGGTLVASTSTVLTNNAVTHGPAIDFPSIVMAAEVKLSICYLTLLRSLPFVVDTCLTLTS